MRELNPGSSVAISRNLGNAFSSISSHLKLLAGGEQLARLDPVARLLGRRRHQLVLHLGQPELELLQRSELDLLIGTYLVQVQEYRA